jgi:hypothetical protein
MYCAKARGRNCASMFEATMPVKVEVRLTLERDTTDSPIQAL